MQISSPIAVSIPETSSELIVTERSFSSYHHGEWNNFACASGASFLGSWGVIQTRRLFGRVKLFDFLLTNHSCKPRKVGQCAVLIANDKVTFLDNIQLAARKDLRNECLGLVTQKLGAHTYCYGSHWNDEESVESADISDFVIHNNAFHVDRIDFRDWGDFDTYRRGVSENIRRDYRKAKVAGAIVETKYGLAALIDLFVLATMRAHMIRRNKGHFSFVLDYFLHFAKLVILGKDGFITTARIKRKYYAAFFGAQFGNKLHYISGGTRSNRLGVGSFLFLTLIERWFSAHPTGKVLMGDCPGLCGEVDHSRGALLYRRKLRVRSVNGAEFQLAPKRSACSKASETGNTQRERGAGDLVLHNPAPRS